MAVIILVLLFSAGVLAQQPPPLAMTFRQDSSDIPYRSPSDLARQIAVETYQDDSDFASENDSDVGTSQVLVKSEVQTTDKDTVDDDSGCVFPFVSVGNHCYHFSSEQMNFADAEAYCENLGHGHAYEATLAMMDYDRYEDQALLDAMNARGNTFWIGGTTEDGVKWSWLDDRPISLQAPFWFYGEPNLAQNKCMMAEVTSSGNHQRTYLHDYECTDSLNFICQTRIPEFRLIGEDYYFLSDEIGLPYAHWQEARDFCQSLYVPLGYHADLAVLSMPQQDDYDLLNKFVSADTHPYAWIGASADNGDCNYHYVDGRPVPISSPYWVYDEPHCGTKQFARLNYVSSHNRTYMADGTESQTLPFICQMYKDV